MAQTLECRGDACPKPVVLASRLIRGLQEPEDVIIHVDNQTAVNNLTAMAAGFQAEAKSQTLAPDHYIVTVHVTKLPAPDRPLAEPGAAPAATAGPGPLVVVISSRTMGQGNDELGAVLMKGFIFALSQLPRRPDCLLFYNGGAYLTAADSPVLEDLNKLAEAGTAIFTCGTCQNFYGLQDRLAVGQVVNMYQITEKMAAAGTVLRP
ncbi:MAG: sulfurtransferase-like selenium metabolism protein YedF [Oscillospiraceae bacterium]|nr:sulfurtransferase-like selenium metabolism protein YedF [Oscillospiraceae bacterium]MDD4367642.1 sulfurtransferase-like selenium metabolism protein YedF [Oscillospiraceae bacterium]